MPLSRALEHGKFRGRSGRSVIRFFVRGVGMAHLGPWAREATVVCYSTLRYNSETAFIDQRNIRPRLLLTRKPPLRDGRRSPRILLVMGTAYFLVAIF